jgi:hypothetical protein
MRLANRTVGEWMPNPPTLSLLESAIVETPDKRLVVVVPNRPFRVSGTFNGRDIRVVLPNTDVRKELLNWLLVSQSVTIRTEVPAKVSHLADAVWQRDPVSELAWFLRGTRAGSGDPFAARRNDEEAPLLRGKVEALAKRCRQLLVRGDIATVSSGLDEVTTLVALLGHSREEPAELATAARDAQEWSYRARRIDDYGDPVRRPYNMAKCAKDYELLRPRIAAGLAKWLQQLPKTDQTATQSLSAGAQTIAIKVFADKQWVLLIECPETKELTP